MIICSCAHITTGDVKKAISWMRAADPQAVVTPGKLYRALGRRPDCGGCIKLLVENMREELSSHATPAASTAEMPIELRNLRPDRKEDLSHDRRRKSNRIS